MRPMPENPYYKPPEDTYAPRPWWRRQSPAENSWIRRDGWQISDNVDGWFASEPFNLIGQVEEIPRGLRFEEMMAHLDATHPLPAPPLRAGQVWLLCARQAWTTALLNSTLDGFLRPGIIGHVEAPFPFECGVEAFSKSTARRVRAIEDQAGMLPGVNMLNMGGWLLGDQFLGNNEAEELLLGDHLDIKTFLIADPVDPSGVPWTGAKGEGGW